MTDHNDGGYFAIKGFLYQFDRALIEMLDNPKTCVAFENRQDIDYEDYVLQIKHKETQVFKPAKICEAVGQLLSLFAASPALKLVLYCFFKDKAPQDQRLSLSELDRILGHNSSHHSKQIRKAFLKNFTIRFSEDYETQFRNLISLLKKNFSIAADEEAIVYHSLFRSHLLTQSILPKDQRHCSFHDLAALRSDSEQTVFYSAYSRYLGAKRYEMMIRKRFFTFRLANIENFERLFILDAEPAAARETLAKFTTRLSGKYFRRGKSPQPYICLRQLSADLGNEVKRCLVDQGVTFFDGTHFDGDRFRLDQLAINRVNDPQLRMKFVPETSLSEILALVDFAEVFQFYVQSPANIATRGRQFCLGVTDSSQALRIID